MRIRLRVLVVVLLGIISVARAQDFDAKDICIAGRLKTYSAAKTTILSKLEDKYDVQYVKIDVLLTNTSVYIVGNCTTVAEVLTNDHSDYAFELSDSLAIDSVFINDNKVSYNHSNGLCTATPVAPLNKGDKFTAIVFYHGTPKTGNGDFDLSGLNNHVVDPYNSDVTYTLSEPYRSSDWWPCKQALLDKIDSADIWITVPSGLKAGSNGLLRNITPISGSYNRYEWHSSYPIDYYLISAAVGPYTDYSYKIKLPGVTDSLLVQNYIYDAPGAIGIYKAGFDSTAYMLQYFSELFGVYPFYKEKYGHCLAPLFGGMEHQTMTTCGNAGPLLVSHELAHQWFGDYISCASWRDVWLNEGFASYAEYLFLKRFRADTAAESRMMAFHKNLLAPNDSGGSIYVDDTNSHERIFNGRLSYSKAAAVIHTLRFVFNNDSLFFAMLKLYQQRFAFGNATTEDFRHIAEEVLQKDLSVFFNQWIYKEGYPVYSAEWNNIGHKVYVKLKQATTHPASVAVFNTPIELKLLFAVGDTTIRLENSFNEQLYSFDMYKPVTGVVIDPNNKILNADRGVVKNIELGPTGITTEPLMLVHNPASDYWILSGIPQNCDIILMDAEGKIVVKDTNTDKTVKAIKADNLAVGMYILHLLQGKTKIASFKLVKL